MSNPIGKIFVVPAPGGLVRYPNSRECMPVEGALVPDDPYWARRILHGDVIKKEPEQVGQTPPPPADVDLKAKRSKRAPTKGEDQ